VVFQPRPASPAAVQVVGEVEGRVPILIDRTVSTGATIASALDALGRQGARPEAYICATHAVLAGPIARTLQREDVQEFAFTNSIPVATEMMAEKYRILSTAPLLAQAIRNIHRNESVSTLFT
jgi:ribose-phosphate pyrophosphokinase